jgi:hypothetical protein
MTVQLAGCLLRQRQILGCAENGGLFAALLNPPYAAQW